MYSKKIKAEIVSQDQLTDDVFSMNIKSEEIASEAHSGQFVSLYSKDGSRLLPRPISICDVNKEENMIRLVYRTVGAGTKEFSQLKSGDMIDIIGPIGNGYDIDSLKEYDSVILMGGGIGIPPMLRLARELRDAGLEKDQVSVILGYRDVTFLLEEFEDIATVYISSDFGTVGFKGNVIEAAKEYKVRGDVICACGPKPMLSAVKAYAAEQGISAFVSLEERMACGVGACLACVCKTTEIDDHSKVKNARICVDGPVFNAEEVEL